MVRRSPATSSVAERVFLPTLHEELGDGWASLFFDCPISKQIWAYAADWPRCQSLAPDVWQDEPEITGAWRCIIEATSPSIKRGIKSLFLLVCWGIWRERNDRIFRGKRISVPAIVARMHDEAREWAFVSAKAMRKLMFEPP
jgi:hypothetical protein